MSSWLRAVLTAGVIALSAGAAQAQSVEIRVDRPSASERMDRDQPRLAQRWDRDRPRYRERRRVREVCRTEIRRRVRPNGVIVERPVRVCRRVVYR